MNKFRRIAVPVLIMIIFSLSACSFPGYSYHYQASASADAETDLDSYFEQLNAEDFDQIESLDEDVFCVPLTDDPDKAASSDYGIFRENRDTGKYQFIVNVGKPDSPDAVPYFYSGRHVYTILSGGDLNDYDVDAANIRQSKKTTHILPASTSIQKIVSCDSANIYVYGRIFDTQNNKFLTDDPVYYAVKPDGSGYREIQESAIPKAQ